MTIKDESGTKFIGDKCLRKISTKSFCITTIFLIKASSARFLFGRLLTFDTPITQHQSTRLQVFILDINYPRA
ncbi:hypothetical protein PGT21_010576 [Puccinia graminis f. sp. tritici]|uniref:Uncharacterized protein n=1 Tax=Puccinia graminis f. sp. tritici TaxID=56615 RepID=A0A5B0P7L4_PUCGR|nr:hypothetical protein PGT21_010576 [Puccinia graminis f. sp. tritici]